MDNINLNAQTRKTRGNSPARALRREKRVPAILYGRGIDSRMLSIAAHDLELVVKKGNLGRSVYNLVVDDNPTPTTVMVKELQTHPVSRSFLHVDFYEVAMDRKIYVPVPVAVTGKCIGVENGGVLQLVRHELEVFCLPGNIPDDITVDVSQLDIGDAIHVEDLQLPADVEIPHDVNFTVLTVSATRKETEGGEEAQAEAVAEPAGEKK